MATGSKSSSEPAKSTTEKDAPVPEQQKAETVAAPKPETQAKADESESAAAEQEQGTNPPYDTTESQPASVGDAPSNDVDVDQYDTPEWRETHGENPAKQNPGSDF
jgi:hypothetical protein